MVVSGLNRGVQEFAHNTPQPEAAADSYVYLCDKYSGITDSWSIYRSHAAAETVGFTGRRVNDGNTQNVGFLANHQTDRAGFGTFCGANVGEVLSINNQCGTHDLQGTVGSLMQIWTGSAVVSNNGVDCAQGQDCLLDTNNNNINFSVSTGNSRGIAIVGWIDYGGGNSGFKVQAFFNNSNRFRWDDAPDRSRWEIDDVQVDSNTTEARTETPAYPFYWIHDLGASPQQYMRENAATNGTATNAATATLSTELQLHTSTLTGAGNWQFCEAFVISDAASFDWSGFFTDLETYWTGEGLGT